MNTTKPRSRLPAVSYQTPVVVRLAPFAQTEGMRVAATLEPQLAALAREAANAALVGLGFIAYAIDVAWTHHENLEPRMPLMSMVVSSIVFVALLAVAIANLIWSFGGSWPIRNRELLARSVLGRPGAAMPPRIVSFAVAAASLATGIVALSLADHTGGGHWLSLLGAALGALFLARGALGYTSGWRARHPEEPFATLDRRNYSPLSLAIGAGFLVLVTLRLI